MSNEVNYRQQWAEGEIEAGTLLDAIDTLEAECEKWHQQFNCMQLQRDHHRDKAKALAAELAAIRAAGGEQVEVVAHFLIPRAGSHAGERFAKAGIPSDSLNSELYTTEPLMTVAQHQRIVAAMAAELAEVRRVQVEVINSRNAHQWECERLTAELEAARKQEPVAECVEFGRHANIIPTEHGKAVLAHGAKLYALPPLAGQVSVPRELLERLLNALDKGFPCIRVAEELRALLATPSMEGDV